MTKEIIYKLEPIEFDKLRDVALGIACPDLTNHEWSKCPLCIDINYCNSNFGNNNAYCDS